MKALITVTVIGFILVAGGIAGLLWQQEMQNRSLQSALRAAQDRLERLESRQTDLTRQLHEAEHRAEVYQAELTKQQRAAAKSEEAAQAEPPQPYQVKTYLGRQYMGQAWVVPSNLSTNAETGQVYYEPILRLDNRLMDQFRESQSARSPREVNYYYNVSSSATAAAAAFVPAFGFGHGHDPGKGRHFDGGAGFRLPGTVQTPFRRNSADDVRQRMQTPSTRPSSYISNVHPGSSFISPRGTVRPQGLGTPASQIRTVQTGPLRR